MRSSRSLSEVFLQVHESYALAREPLGSARLFVRFVFLRPGYSLAIAAGQTGLIENTENLHARRERQVDPSVRHSEPSPDPCERVLPLVTTAKFVIRSRSPYSLVYYATVSSYLIRERPFAKLASRLFSQPWIQDPPDFQTLHHSKFFYFSTTSLLILSDLAKATLCQQRI